MKAVIAATRLCFAATVGADGEPNLSPKGTINVWDDTHLFFLDIASPGTRANLARSARIEINVVDQTSRRGYRFGGRATLYGKDTAEYAEAVRRAFDGTDPDYPVNAVVIIAVDRAAPLLSPAYWHVKDENELREMWKKRRVDLDREFEGYIARVGSVPGVVDGG
jgi:predicted pyridoxine 5'-phosphate oxidase superfamily flavin-nucleotide-binding protein